MSEPNLLALFWGPGFIGFLFSMSLYGVTLAQTVFYYRTFTEDPNRLKLLVAALCIVDSLHIVFVMKLFWSLTLTARFNPMPAVDPWEMAAASLTTYVVTFMVQSFYGRRVWRLSSKNRVLTGIIALLALLQFGSGIAFGIRQLSPFTAGPNGMYANEASGTLELSSTVLCDIFITGSLVYYLRSKRTDVRRSDSVLQKLIIYTVHVGLIGCAVACTALVMFVVPLGIFMSAAPHFVVSKCYVNSVLATLNARRAFRQMFHDNMDGTNALPVLSDVEPIRFVQQH